MIVFFYIIVLWALLGWVIGNTYLGRKVFSKRFPKQQYYSLDTTPRMWVTIQSKVTEPTQVKVRFLGNKAHDLAKDVEIVTNGRILAEQWGNSDYMTIFNSLSKEQLYAVRELRGFLK